MRIKRYLVAFVLLACCSTNLAIAGSQHVQLNVLRTYPFGYQDETSANVGTFWEYFQRLKTTSKFNIDTYIVPKSRVIQYLKEGSTDGAILFRTKKLEQYVNFVVKIREIPIRAVTLSGKTIDHYDTLKRQERVGIFRSGAISERFDNDNTIKKVSVNSYPKLLEMLVKKRVDVIAGNGVVLEALIAKNCLQNQVTFADINLGTKEQWFAMSKASAHLQKSQQIANTLSQLKDDGTLDDIFEKHLINSQSNCS